MQDLEKGKIDNLKELYSKKINIMKYFRDHSVNSESNSLDAVLCAYDYQAGSYTEKYNSDRIVKNTYIQNGQPIDLRPGEYTRSAAKSMSDIMNKLSFWSMLEVGVGEATTICDILENFTDEKEAWGIELSLSRLFYAQKFIKQKKSKINLAVGNMFSLPFSDSSMDLVFTYYCLGEHRGREKAAIEEMLRVSNQYILLVEPSYELGNEETKNRIDKLKYIKNLEMTLKEMDVEIIEHRLFDVFTFNNNAAITVLQKKNKGNNQTSKTEYVCPKCKNKLITHNGNFFCTNCFKIYPVMNKIPLLTEENGILCSKYLEF